MKIWVVLIGALASASPLFAQEPTPPLVPQHSQTVMETLMKAGPVMIPLFLLSIFFVMLVVVYLMTIRRGAVVSSGYMATADALLRKRDYLGLLAVSNRHGEAIARVVQKMLPEALAARGRPAARRRRHQRCAASELASRIAATRLEPSARPVPARSNAVP